MAQAYKSVYFPDHPGESAKERNLTLAFGDRDKEIFNEIKLLTSQEIRERLGHHSYQSLIHAANEETLLLNTYCVRRLRNSRPDLTSYSGQLFPEIEKDEAIQPLIDPILATFRGGESEPLHSWFPYLEGYSPQFVTRALQEFSPRASKILDPFAGTGTTPLTAAAMGLESYFCELNPLLQFLIDAKKLALTLPIRARADISEKLRSIGQNLGRLLNNSAPDRHLIKTYKEVFGTSAFFENKVFLQILKSRTLVDDVSCEDPLAGKFLTVSILSSLVPVSLLIRRGDLRFKTTEELRKRTLKFVEVATNNLALIIRDLETIEPSDVKLGLVVEDARCLEIVPSLDVDVVMTSPPYLNGTNYFRNTKVELWFLRALCNQRDLSAFRFRAVTAGINDVTNGKATAELVPDVRGIVDTLSATAYDQRIPKMVSSYFSEMRTIFSALKKHISPGGRVILDIGDSAYGNVHVPTHKLLGSIFSGLGYRLEREILLRKRNSRGGFPLRQSLLIFNLPLVAKQSFLPYEKKLEWEAHWSKFKRDLPHQKDEFAKRNWGHSLHSLCSYQGKMKPSLAHFLVRTFLPKGGRLLDPFGGVGTIPFEAALLGGAAYCFEISPAALCISTAKLEIADGAECNSLLTRLKNYIDDGKVFEAEVTAASRIRFNGALAEYFSPKTMCEILLARRYFAQNYPRTASEFLVLACLLHILHGNRPYALSRRSHPITPFAPTGPSEYRGLIGRLQEKVQRSLASPRGEAFRPGVALNQDATLWWPQEIKDLDAIITSPPFFDSTRFHLANWMRLWFCGWEADDFKVRPLSFVDERQKADFSVYEPVLRQARERLKPGGICVLHLGKSKKCDMAKMLSTLATRWFRVVDQFTETVDHCESHGIRDKGAVTAHQFLVLQ